MPPSATTADVHAGRFPERCHLVEMVAPFLDEVARSIDCATSNVARRSGLARISADQQTTQDWWDFRRAEYDVFISELVLDESASGDPIMAAARLKKLTGLPQLAQTHAVDLLAQRIIERGIIPLSAAPDATHIALSAVHAMNFLLTWNCKHIANAFNHRRLEASAARPDTSVP